MDFGASNRIRDGKKYYAGDMLPDGTVVKGNKLYPYIPLSTLRQAVGVLSGFPF
jgi:hypothetical protein